MVTEDDEARPSHRILNLRASDAWFAGLSEILAVVAKKPSREKAAWIRRLVEKDRAFWLQSPYFAKSVHHFVFVAADGTVFSRSADCLRLNTYQLHLPMRFALRPEPEFLESWLRHPETGWAFHQFAAWHGDEQEGLPDVRGVDHDGRTTKQLSFPINQSEDSTLCREALVVLNQHAQVRTVREDFVPDRMDFEIAIPTLDFTAEILVDRALYKTYRDDPKTFRTAAVSREFRNFENARFESRVFDGQEHPPIWRRGRVIRPAKTEARSEEMAAQAKNGDGKDEEETPSAAQLELRHDPGTEEVQQQVLGSFQRLRTTLTAAVELAQAEEQEKDQAATGARAVSALALPEEYLFGRLHWRVPYLGLRACLTWNKPNDPVAIAIRHAPG